jgi:hypothetical protein
MNDEFIISEMKDIKIEVVWTAVVNFIEWYKSKKK